MKTFKRVAPIAAHRAQTHDVDACMRQKVVLRLIQTLELTDCIKGLLRNKNLVLKLNQFLCCDLVCKKQVQVLDVLHPRDPHWVGSHPEATEWP